MVTWVSGMTCVCQHGQTLTSQCLPFSLTLPKFHMDHQELSLKHFALKYGDFWGSMLNPREYPSATVPRSKHSIWNMIMHPIMLQTEWTSKSLQQMYRNISIRDCVDSPTHLPLIVDLHDNPHQSFSH